MTKISILGGGSWGTALAIVLSRSHQPHDISLWMRDPLLAVVTNGSRENSFYLPGCRVPYSVEITSDLTTALRGADYVIGAMPAAHAREIYTRALSCLTNTSSAVFVSATKGLEPATHLRMTEILAQLFEAKSFQPLQVAVLSGPSFALEAARGDPTAVVIASAQESCATGIQQEFAGPHFRIYTNDDVVGVELAGAMKNVIAIAAGACQGLGLGTNAIAALITRGLAEMSRLAFALGAKSETLSGLAGLGDLVLTCTGALSRNRQLGIELGKGRALPEILASTRTVAEGVGTAAALLALATEHHIELPITSQVDAILHHGKPPREAISAIMERPQKRE
jgi:glycerol-3-phosphate dehydrogenase (NAD(P)+)